jgi:hypothetical protein
MSISLFRYLYGCAKILVKEQGSVSVNVVEVGFILLNFHVNVFSILNERDNSARFFGLLLFYKSTSYLARFGAKDDFKFRATVPIRIILSENFLFTE